MKKIKYIILLVCVCCITACTKNNVLDVSTHLYKVSKDNKYFYILGTNHTAKAYSKLDSVTEEALDESDKLILEVDMDMSKTQEYVKKMKINNIKDEFTDQQKKQFNVILNQYNILSKPDVNEYNIATISSLCTEEVSNKDGYFSKNSIDLYLYNRAMSENKLFDQFETVEEQYNLLAELSKEAPDYYLEELSDYNAFYKYVNTFNKMYYESNRVEWQRYMDKYLSLDNLSEEGVYVFDKINLERNVKVVDKIDHFFKDNYILFVGIGVSHLEGNKGILCLLEEKGYVIEYYEK